MSRRPKRSNSLPPATGDHRQRPLRPRGHAPQPTRTASAASGSRPEPARPARRETPAKVVAEAAAQVASHVERQVLQQGKRADHAIANALRGRSNLQEDDRLFIRQAVLARFRWHGWIEPLRLRAIEERLLLACLLDFASVLPVFRVWAKALGRDPSRLLALGDAPTWPARANGFKQLLANPSFGADPWRLFPSWFRRHLPPTPFGVSAKVHHADLMRALQARPPVWVRAQGGDAEALWREVAETGPKPWPLRQVPSAAKLPPDTDVRSLPAYRRGLLEIQDLASQAVGLVCDPQPGQRWWDACAGSGGKALHLAALMAGKGLVVASDIHEPRLKEAARRARRSPFRNLTTKPWDGQKLPSKSGRFDGVLVDAPCSAIGTWRRSPDARWTFEPSAIPRLTALQGQLLQTVAPAVRPNGTLVYAVATLTVAETREVVHTFLDARPEFRLDPFPHPLTAEPTDGTLQIWPHPFDTEALFLARLVRTR